MGKFAMVLVAILALAGLGLAGCNKSNQQTSPGEQIQQGAQQMGQGLKSAGNQAVQAASDTVSTTKVKAKLAANQGLSSFDIHVETENGIVTLTGAVDTTSERDLAGRIAANTEGVKGVNNYIKIKQSGY